MMRDLFLKVRTTKGEPRMINLRNISMVAPSDGTREPECLTFWLTKGTGFDAVGNMQEFENAVMLGCGMVVELHDFTFEDQEKEGEQG